MPDDPISNAVDAAMFECPLLDEGRGPAVSREECETMVRAAIATYLNETAALLGKTVGLCFADPDD